jgi:hypothetical protein
MRVNAGAPSMIDTGTWRDLRNQSPPEENVQQSFGNNQ